MHLYNGVTDFVALGEIFFSDIFASEALNEMGWEHLQSIVFFLVRTYYDIFIAIIPQKNNHC